MATEDFGQAMEWMGRSAPWSDDVLAYQWALAYWFLEGEPDRMDIDGNGIPCELLFDTAAIAEVLAGATSHVRSRRDPRPVGGAAPPNDPSGLCSRW